MCHEYHNRRWERRDRERGDESVGDDSGDEPERPDFFSDEVPEDVELLTDGGDE
jgi:hypothetical protein